MAQTFHQRDLQHLLKLTINGSCPWNAPHSKTPTDFFFSQHEPLHLVFEYSLGHLLDEALVTYAERLDELAGPPGKQNRQVILRQT